MELQDITKKETMGGARQGSGNKRRNIKDCKYWNPRGKKTHYCSINENEPFKQCYGVCKQFCKK